jgi:diguanylate cyclase (GGDEF)-like protein
VSQGHDWEDTKRRLYVACVALASPTIPMVMYLRWDAEPALRFIYPLLIALALFMLVGLATRQIATRTAEVTMLTVLPTLWLGRLFATLYISRDLDLAAELITQSIAPGFMVLAIVAYLAFDVRRGLAVAAGLIVAYLLMITPAVLGVLQGTGPAAPAIALLRPSLVMGAAVALLYCLAVLKSQVAAQTARTALFAELSRTDELTGLPNRRAASDRLQHAIAVAERYDHPLTVAVVDVDHFKRLNDTYGHAVGDQVLRDVADLMADDLRETDMVARWGGDELLVVMPDTAPGEGARSLDRSRQRVRDQVIVRPSEDMPALPVTLSVGVTAWVAADTPDTLLYRADQALYMAKDQGRNRVSLLEAGEVPPAPPPGRRPSPILDPATSAGTSPRHASDGQTAARTNPPSRISAT